MIASGLFIVATIVCVASFLICLVAAFIHDYPDDVAIISVAAVELLLVVYAAVAGVRQLGGDSLVGAGWEFWGYVLTAFIIPIIAFWWAVTDKTRWSNVVLAAVGATVAVMLVRMEQIWHGGIFA